MLSITEEMTSPFGNATFQEMANFTQLWLTVAPEVQLEFPDVAINFPIRGAKAMCPSESGKQHNDPGYVAASEYTRQ